MTTISPGHATPFGRFVHGINRHHLRAKWAVPAPGQQLPLDLDLDLDLAGASAANGGDAASPRRLGWANLLARVFAVDVTVCRKCGGRMRVLDVVRDPDDIARILHGARAPPRPPRPHPPGQALLFPC